MTTRIGVAVAALFLALPVRAAQPTEASAEAAGQLVAQYCITCHNETANTADLALDAVDVANPGGHAEIWEMAVRKIRTGMMPPRGAPRPDRESLDGLASWLEAQLDEAAAADPDPGAPTLHRLNRTEYANAIRDLLELEVDASLLLPVDSSAAGFDNIAEVLGTSPALVQGYLSAALKVSRLAVGDLTEPPKITTYDAPEGLPQDTHLEGLPLGTRGGMVVTHNFPLDAEYEFGGGGRGADFTIDGEPVVIGGRGGRLPVSAGPHTLAVSNVRAMDSGGLDETFSAPERGRGGASITVTGPFNPSGAGDTPSRRRILTCTPSGSEDAAEIACARKILSGLATRAFRRPIEPNDSELDTLVEFYRNGRLEGTFEAGIQHALARILVDPRFVFRMEDVPSDLPAGAVYSLSNLELATRLSFFIWSSIPDDRLLEVADAGRLSDPGVLEAETLRMLADPKARALVDNFGAQWMGLRDLEEAEPDVEDFDAGLKIAFERETTMLIESIIRDNRSIVDLVNADYTFVDERLAAHYGIPDVRGSRVRRVALASDDPRRGVLGHGSVLLVTSVANRTSPVTRGAWVLENLMGAPPPSPPPGVETNLDESPEDVEPRTLRERMEQHRSNPACASCHSIMDPIGFALENFDLVGRWRAFDGETPIDATSELVDGTRIDGPVSLREALLDRKEVVVSTAVAKLMTYAVGRETTYADMPAIRRIVRDAADDEYRFRDLVVGVVKSDPFLERVKQ